MFGQMVGPDLPNQMYAELVRSGERLARRVARERKTTRRLDRRTARPRPVVQPAVESPRTTLSPETRFRLVNAAHREGREAFRAATDDAESRGSIGAATADPRVPISANPGLYSIVAGFVDRRQA